MSASRLDAVYRSILITKFFTKGWGKPDNLRRWLTTSILHSIVYNSYYFFRVYQCLSIYAFLPSDVYVTHVTVFHILWVKHTTSDNNVCKYIRLCFISVFFHCFIKTLRNRLVFPCYQTYKEKISFLIMCYIYLTNGSIILLSKYVRTCYFLKTSRDSSVSWKKYG